MFAFYERLGLPVWASNREVIAAVRSRLTKACRRDPIARDERHKLYRSILKEHRDALDLYQRVASERI